MRQKNTRHFWQHAAILMMAVVMLTGLSACKTQTAAVTSPPATGQKPEPVRMILDSDFGSSTDDLFALMMLHHYIDEGKVDLKGIIVDREGEKNAGIVDIFNNYYGHPDIPVGLERNGVKNPRCFIPYNGICDLTDLHGNPLFKRSLSVSQFPEGYKLYRQLLSQADDHSIVIVAIGFVTTLSQLMESGADEYSPLSGLELLGQKVKSIYIQSGRFEAGDSLSGYNMRAASSQSSVFYGKLPRNIDLIMSPSNIGDGMNYLPQDVLTDLSYTTLNPIKAVYTNYTCDTGQRMWDTNCVVNAVLGDSEYRHSPRGFVTFVDRGEESLMLFRQAPQGNARYQLPGDSYFNQEKLMEIRRYNRINKHPAAYTIEAPQPQLTGAGAVEWVRPRLGQLVDKYLGSARNTLNPDDVRAMLRPIGYIGSNVQDYTDAGQMVTDSIYSVMLRRAISRGKNDLVIVTGPPASGKTTVVAKMNFGKAGLIYDAALGGDRLEQAIEKAKCAGIKQITLTMVYNDPMTCLRNSISRGKTQWRFTSLDELIGSFRDCDGKLSDIQEKYPDVKIVPIDCSGNNGLKQVSLAEAAKWKYNLDEADVNRLLRFTLGEINSGALGSYEIPAVVGNIFNMSGLGSSNQPLVLELDRKARVVTCESR